MFTGGARGRGRAAPAAPAAHLAARAHRGPGRGRLPDVRLPARLRVRRRRRRGRHARPADLLLRGRLGHDGRPPGRLHLARPAAARLRPPPGLAVSWLAYAVIVAGGGRCWPCGAWPGCAERPVRAGCVDVRLRCRPAPDAPECRTDPVRSRNEHADRLPQGARHRERLRDRPGPRERHRPAPGRRRRPVRPPRGHRRRRAAARRAVRRAPRGRGHGGRGGVVHGLPQRRRLDRRDVRQRRAGLRPLPPARRARRPRATSPSPRAAA